MRPAAGPCSASLVVMRAGRGQTTSASLSLNALETADSLQRCEQAGAEVVCIDSVLSTGAGAQSSLSQQPVLNMSPLLLPPSTLSFPFVSDLTMTHPCNPLG